MDKFKTFETNKAAKFLNKAKSLKNNREADIRRAEGIIKMQKNIRAFLEYIRNAHKYPHMLRSFEGIDPSLLKHIWADFSSQPKIIQQRFAHIVFQSDRGNSQIKLQQDVIKALMGYSLDNHLKVDQYEILIAKTSNAFNSDYICQNLKKRNFCVALQGFIRSNIYRLVEIILRVNDFAAAQEILRLFFENCNNNVWRAQANESEQQILRSFYNFTAIFTEAINKIQDTSLYVKLMSILIKKLKSFYSQLVLKKYSISRQMFQSSELKEQIQQFISEKQEWQEYISHLHPLLSLVPVIMRTHLSKNQDIILSSLDILIQLTNSNQALLKIDLSAEEFIALIQRLVTNTNDIFSQQQHHSLSLVKVILGEKYLQSLNDLKFIRLFQYQKRRLGQAIQNCLIKYMRSLMGLCQKQAMNQQVIKHSVALCRNLYNKIFRTCLLSTKIFQDKTIQFLQNNRLFSQMGNANNFKQLQEMVERCPFLLSIEARFIIFRKMISQMNRQYIPGFSITIHRNHDFDDAIKQLFNRDIRSRFQVRFVDEFDNLQGGVDAGGLTKQFLTRVFKTAFDPKQRRFIENDKKQLIPNPQYYRNDSGKIAQEYEFIGRLLGKSLVQNIMLGVKFAGPFLNLLINNRNSFDDLLHIDTDLYKSLIYIAEMQTGVEELELTFAYHDNLTNKIINLKPRGEKIRVNNDNKTEYIDLLVNYKVNRSIQTQTRHIRKGLRSVINDEWLKAFNYAEFSYLLSGTGKIDVNDWMKYAIVNGANIDEINRFWAVVTEFSEEQKSLLLKFVTSCQRPSFLGFKDLSPPFTVLIQHNSDNKLPVSHTCSNTLELPNYLSAQIMREKLLYAIKSASGFQMA